MREKIGEKYILKEDMVIVENWAQKLHSVGISFRPAGEQTLKCLSRGAGAKPHQILDKTLKKKAGNSESAQKHNNAVETFFLGFDSNSGTARELLMGLVGHWNGGQVDGVYLTTAGYDALKDNFSLGQHNGKYYLVLQEKEQKNDLISYFTGLFEKYDKKADYFFTRLFFSGDYDIHDFLKDKKTVPTLLDMDYIKSLQENLIAGRREQLIRSYNLQTEDFEKEESTDYQRVQHGPQFNYTAQMLNENNKCTKAEKLNILVESVINLDPPVAIYDNDVLKGQWKILSDAQAVSDYYAGNGLVVKETWRSPQGRESFIINNLKRIVRLCFPDAKQRADVSSQQLLKEIPELKEIYRDKYDTYFEEALKKMFSY